MKILIVNTLYEPYKIGGAEISVQAIAEGLIKNGIEVAVMTLGENYEEVIINNVQVWRLKLNNIYWPFGDFQELKIKKLKWHFKDIYNNRYTNSINQIINKFNPDIIHTNNLMGFSVAVWDIAKKRNIRIVHTLRDYYLQCPKTNKFKNNNSCNKQCWECSIFSRKKKEISQNVDCVVGISNDILQNHIDEGYFKESIKKVIYNGFEINTGNLKPENFKEDSFLKFGFIGQINEAKGIEVLIKSLKEFICYNNWKLFIAGNVDSQYKEHLQSFLPLDRMEFMGYTKQEVFFKEINVLVVPSLWEEPFGRVVLEGLINNTVVLGSTKGGIKEILSNNKKFTFDPMKGELKSLIQSIIINPKKLNNFNFDEQEIGKFSIRTTIEKYIELYNMIIS